jgi:Ni,Fe-hydrogenase III large subunit
MNQDLASLLAGLAPKVAGHRPWPRHILDRKGWLDLLGQLEGADYPLLGLWGDDGMVHLALRDGPSAAVASLPCPDRRYPAVSPCRPAAARLERAARDLFGLAAEGAADVRPWLDHGRWPHRRPTGAEPGTVSATAYEFLPAEAQGAVLHQIPVGPIHAGIIEPGHFRFHVNGETVVRLEARLGFTHKGIESKMADKTPAEAARLASRISGDSAVGHSLAFAHAVEAALEVVAPPRAHFLRALMAELERLANHFGDIGAICNDATFPLLLAHFSALREQVLRAAQSCFGHRLMMDCIVPGGVAVDLDAAGTAQLAELVRDLRPRLAELVRVYDSKSSLLDRMVLTGIVKTELVHRFGAGGYIGRASGNGHDARRNPGYPPYSDLEFRVPVLTEGDVNARVQIRAQEAAASLDLVDQLLAAMPAGPLWVELPTRTGEGMALIEGFRGEIMTWVRLAADGRIQRCHPRDPSWFQWPLLEAAVEGNIVADFPLCNKSFNCSYAGVDL